MSPFDPLPLLTRIKRWSAGGQGKNEVRRSASLASPLGADSDTSFIPHELSGIPVKRGAAIVHVKFETISEIEFKSNLNHEARTSIITLSNGKTGEFQLAVMGSFNGASDFEEVRVPASEIKRVLFK